MKELKNKMIEYKREIQNAQQEGAEKTLFTVYAAGDTQIKKGNIELKCADDTYYQFEVSMRSIESTGPKNLWVIMNCDRKNAVQCAGLNSDGELDDESD